MKYTKFICIALLGLLVYKDIISLLTFGVIIMSAATIAIVYLQITEAEDAILSSLSYVNGILAFLILMLANDHVLYDTFYMTIFILFLLISISFFLLNQVRFKCLDSTSEDDQAKWALSTLGTIGQSVLLFAYISFDYF